MKKKIIIIGRSQKFIKIIKKLYIHDEISILAWRKLDKPNKYRSHKNPNIIFVCGYDYNSHWYDYTKYYKTNISSPLKFINSTWQNLHSSRKSNRIYIFILLLSVLCIFLPAHLMLINAQRHTLNFKFNTSLCRIVKKN